MKRRYNWSAKASWSCVEVTNNKSVATKFIMAGFFEFSHFCFRPLLWEYHVVICAGRVAVAQDELFRTLQTDQPTEQVFSKWKVHGNMRIDTEASTRKVKLLLNKPWLLIKSFYSTFKGNCVQYRLLVRDVKTLQILQLYTCLDVVQCIEVRNVNELHIQISYLAGCLLFGNYKIHFWTPKQYDRYIPASCENWNQWSPIWFLLKLA